MCKEHDLVLRNVDLAIDTAGGDGELDSKPAESSRLSNAETWRGIIAPARHTPIPHTQT